MTDEMIDVKVKNQYGKVLDAKALLHEGAKEIDPSRRIVQQVEYIMVDGEIIRPSIELLFNSERNDCIYRIMEHDSLAALLKTAPQ
ncbi:MULTISPECIES: hypothetical protein [Acinetobacter]|uniref:hypothetical protein n=1 Tax=Acinetobacter TaxID=469 RepID=UPI00053926B4|nr:hypothetical protein [Acinetobacter sp. HR7]KGT46336.1 hypothetical protein GW12_26220 [Acinetobacter sp. HR7]